jgi:hypothetical protein
LEAHQHDVVYYGVVNLVYQSKIIGTIDVWRCRSCSEIFCEEKRFGATELAPEVGFPKVDRGSKWAALVCMRDNGSNWTLTAAKPGATIVHSCTPETKLELSVGSNYSLDSGPVAGVGRHNLVLIEDFVNNAVDVESGQKHTGTTDAYQALGKPFSFTPPLSAAVVQSSKARFLNLALLFFLISGASLLGAASVFRGYQLGLGVIVGIIGFTCLTTGYSIYRRSTPGPLGFVVVAAPGVLFYISLRLQAANLGVLDYAVASLAVVDMVVAWRAWGRIRRLKSGHWHPLDMPAYG